MKKTIALFVFAAVAATPARVGVKIHAELHPETDLMTQYCQNGFHGFSPLRIGNTKGNTCMASSVLVSDHPLQPRMMRQWKHGLFPDGLSGKGGRLRSH